ncbi:MAG: hypothetical protein H6813_00325 [Phycisphaeraceae bacterium]|nr:hypothetical protein [Phycisphaeraceae bacterium]MCB9847470.1 hypothetical protein [Phycisphaeraceae bacterium]
MKLKTTTLAIAVCIPIGAGARAQELQAIQAGVHLTPIRAAVLNADMSMRTGWVDYQEALNQRGSLACSAAEALSYDCFQADTDGTSPIGADTDCGQPTPDFRYFFGETSCSQRTADDFTMEPGFGEKITRITGAFYWYGDGNPANSEQCFVVIQIWDDLDATCTGPAIDNFLGNVIVDLGPLQNNPGSYYAYDIDVCAVLGGIGIPAPADGSGGVDVILANSYDQMLGQVTLATCAQPMIWGTAANRPGSQQNLPYWGDDDQSFDFDPGTECFDFTGLADCPDNLGTMIALYTATGDPCAVFECADANVDSVVTVFDVDPFVVAVQDPAQYEIFFPGIDPLCPCDTDMSGVLDNFDIGPFVSAVSGGGCVGFGPRNESVRVFLATDGLSDPNNPQSPAVTPQLVNPELIMNNDYPRRLYLWIDLETLDMAIKGFSFNVHTTGLAEITDAVLYNNIFSIIGGTTWNSSTPAGVVQPADTSGDGTRWSGANAMAVTESGASNEAISLTFDQHYNATTGAKLLGHIEIQGPGEVFLEVGDKGIASVYDSPGPGISLGFGDEADGLNGASYNTGSSMADATARCVGDLNGDLVVDTADLGILLSQFGMSGSADLNNDGAVDTADLGILLAQFNTTCGPIS